MLDEVFASNRQELAFGRSIDGFPADDLLGERPSVLLDIVPKVGLRSVRADHQDIGHAPQCVADLAEELVFGSNRAAVLMGVVLMGLDSLGLHVFGVEPQHFGFVMINMDCSTQR